MPEGDTIHRTAARLRPVLENKELIAFDAPRLVGARPKPGDRISAVEAVGKHLLIRFESGLVLQTHMKMTGSWHMYRAGERWRQGAHLMRALVDVGDWIAVCFAAPVVRTYHEAAPVDASPIAHLGPDLCADRPDIDRVIEFIGSRCDPTTALADLLLDQRVACGVGNVYKSEALWACRISPFASVDSLTVDQQHQLFETASKQLRANLNTANRTTVPGGLAVYGRHQKPCRACGTLVRMKQFGVHPRSTYWCPSCQPDPDTCIDGSRT